MMEFNGRNLPTELSEIVDPKKTVLLIWDMQNDQAGGSFNKEELIKHTPPLVAAARKARVKIIYVIVGCTTDGGVEATVRDEFNGGCFMVVARDCVGTYTEKGHLGALKRMETVCRHR